MNKALTISFLSHAALLILVITVSFSHSILMKNIYVVNLVSMPSPVNQIVSIKQAVPSITKSSPVHLEQIPGIRRTNKTLLPQNREKTFSSENYMKSLERRLANIAKSFKTQNRPSSTANNYSPKIKSIKSSKKVLPVTPFGQQIPAGYFTQIKNIIQQHWQIPHGNIYSNPAVVSFRLWNDGTFSDIILETGSGSQRFDDSSINAIKSVNKFPPFPENLNARYVDITITFTEGGIK
ncbi:MAG: TonB family protein [Candidatus Omnitrophica bacterium]|nr:TonB family protein [Candidatus Omnitrophota bacterium]